MYTIKMEVVGFPLKIDMVKGKVREIELKLRELGNQTAENMRANIEPRRTPSTGRLASSIQAHLEPWGVGVGKVDLMPPYWFVVNYGAYYPEATRPFVPGGGEYRPVWFGDGAPDLSKRGVGGSRATSWDRISRVGGSIPSPISPMNYIEKTTNWLQSNWVNFLRR